MAIQVNRNAPLQRREINDYAKSILDEAFASLAEHAKAVRVNSGGKLVAGSSQDGHCSCAGLAKNHSTVLLEKSSPANCKKVKVEVSQWQLQLYTWRPSEKELEPSRYAIERLVTSMHIQL